MKPIFFFFCSIALSFGACAAESENVLQVFADNLSRRTTQDPPPIALTAKLVSHEERLFLAFRLTNISQKPIQFYPSMLPWGSPSSLRFAGVATNGTKLRNTYLIAHPSALEKVVIAPGEFREGEYPLDWGVDYEDAPPGTDVLLMWVYRVFSGFEAPFPMCSGVVVIPKRP